MAVTYRAVTVFGAPFQGTSAGVSYPVCGSYNPGRDKHARFGLGPVSLAATPGISVDFSSSGY